MTGSDKIDIVVKLPLDITRADKMRMSLIVASDILKERNWRQPLDQSLTLKEKDNPKPKEQETLFRLSGYDNPDRVEFRIRITSKMTNDDLMDLAFRFIDWMARA